ncbi:MAG: oxygenase MpaB family protein [Gammaproteobacteria bacterium]|nr:oxygenase MpaB family protein [Gammaproteobacteria bacterium]
MHHRHQNVNSSEFKCPMHGGRALINHGLFGPSSISWKMNADVSMLIAAPAAALLQMLHPDVVRIIEKNHRYYHDPIGRAKSTALYAQTTVYGDTEMAAQASQALKSLHDSLGAKDPVTGKVYTASEPKLLLWVQNTLTWMILRTAEQYGPQLNAKEREQFIEEQKIAGELVGLKKDMLPSTYAELEDYIFQMTPQLKLTEDSIHFRDFILKRPFPKNFSQLIEHLFMQTIKRIQLPVHKKLYDIETSGVSDMFVENLSALVIKTLRYFYPAEKLIPKRIEELTVESYNDKKIKKL